MKLRSIALLAGLAVLGSAQAASVILYDNLDPGGYIPTNGWTISTVQSLGLMFTPSVTATLSQLHLTLSSFEPVQGSQNVPLYDIQLVDSVPSDPNFNTLPFLPGSNVLASWSDVAGAGLNVLTPSASVQLAAGTSYWVIVSPGTSYSGPGGLWLFNANGKLGDLASNFGSVWFDDDSSVAGGMRVVGETSVPVPEPATLALAGLGLGLAARRRARRV